MNAMGVPGRLIPAVLADRYAGPMNMLVLVSAATAALLFAWTAVASLGGLTAFSVLYGLLASGILGLFPVTLGALSPDVQKTGVRMGMGFSFVSFACLAGPPIGGALVSAGDGSYRYAQVYAGSVMLLASALLLAARLSVTGWKFRVKI